eukprot:CAMPEP_0177787976 /NCGR_PEP_ID=MMETSP0491_2-20121128/21833_1 /TAXON_ID=63592 /ORGANISM="Tetraselmis chuii, Strain PLY429" /LENGTH=190 /DNA_ID=CAMNT_0019309469 /DNA_START=1649 /DNA_END=2222 /DNA_ORIENTATION=+
MTELAPCLVGHPNAVTKRHTADQNLATLAILRALAQVVSEIDPLSKHPTTIAIAIGQARLQNCLVSPRHARRMEQQHLGLIEWCLYSSSPCRRRKLLICCRVSESSESGPLRMERTQSVYAVSSAAFWFRITRTASKPLPSSNLATRSPSSEEGDTSSSLCALIEEAFIDALPCAATYALREEIKREREC